MLVDGSVREAPQSTEVGHTLVAPFDFKGALQRKKVDLGTRAAFVWSDADYFSARAVQALERRLLGREVAL